jgi:hypothetical protein
MNLRLLRGLAGATTLALLATALLSVPAMGADTRVLWIGAPDLTVDTSNPPDGIPDNAGILDPTPVSVPAAGKGPYATKFEVQILNGGGQNLANTVLIVNADVQNVASLSLNTIYDPDPLGADDDFCSSTGDTITCTYGSLPAGTERTIAVVVNVTSAYNAGAQVKPLFSASVTTNNENGSNQQTFMATSGPWEGSADPGFGVDAFGANGLNTFLLSGQTPSLATAEVGGAAGNLSTQVDFTTSNRELVQINEGTNPVGFYQCPAGLNCQPDFSEVTTTSGAFGAPQYFRWTLTAIVPKTYALSQGFVAHYPTDAADPDWILLFKSKAALCGDNIAAKIESQGQCINALSLTKFDKTSNQLVVEVIMKHQGGMRF